MDDTVETPVTPDLPTMFHHIHDILENLEMNDQCLQFRAQANLADPAAWERFQHHFEAAGLVCMAQNCLRTQQEAKKPIGGLSYLNHARIIHTRCMSVIAGQYGIMDNTMLGWWLVIQALGNSLAKSSEKLTITQRCNPVKEVLL